MRIISSVFWRKTSECIYSTRCRKNQYRFKSTAVGEAALSSSTAPVFVEKRFKLWTEFKEKYQNAIDKKPKEAIVIQLTNGEKTDAVSWQDTPYQVLTAINKKQADDAIVVLIDGIPWDLNRPLEKTCRMDVVGFEGSIGKQVFWHSSAHVLGAALESKYGGLLGCGPATERGFHYDIFLDRKTISANELGDVERCAKQFIEKKERFERIEVNRDDLLRMFDYNKFKLRLIDEKIEDGDCTTLYRCGNFIDLCRGPHIRHAGRIKKFQITNNSPAFWQGNVGAEKLERVYGISFPSNELMKEWQKEKAEAAQRNHRKIGRDQDLFFFHEFSPGSCFFQPKGAHIYNTLVNFLKTEYRKRGYQEVITPNIFKTALWKQSGHWDHYAEHMFTFKTEKETFALKPMNCPGHCLIFANDVRSYRDLPMRLADFGVLHRNEFAGGLTGLTRVRRFQQDDAHIFCTSDQIKSEIDGCLDFLSYVYKTFGFSFELVLSTRPDSFIGDIETWNRAETALEESLNAFGLPWKLNEGDGAFYGPKIDITISDALKRPHQCATIQLDFQLPERFELSYAGADDKKTRRPVIIHRAIFGSVERLMAILTENYAGKWPFWLSPRQAIVVPVHPSFSNYAEQVQKRLHEANFMVEADLSTETMNKKIRNAQTAQFNFILCVGQKEVESDSVNVRTRNNKVNGIVKVDDLIGKFNQLRNDFVLGEDVF